MSRLAVYCYSRCAAAALEGPLGQCDWPSAEILICGDTPPQAGHRQAFISESPDTEKRRGFFMSEMDIPDWRCIVILAAPPLRSKARRANKSGLACNPPDLICGYTHPQAGHRQALLLKSPLHPCSGLYFCLSCDG